jgi:anti-sigma factor RsiW
MPTETEQLDQDALLMLYVADELSAEQRAELEGRLAGDPELAAELARLRDARDVCFAALARADGRGRLPMSEGVAVRRVGRAMRQWQVERELARNAAAPAAPRRKLAWWVYPSAAAAAIIVGFLVWSVRQPVGASMPPDPRFADYQVAQDRELADWISESLRSRADVQADREFFSAAISPSQLDGSTDLDGVFLREESEQ